MRSSTSSSEAAAARARAPRWRRDLPAIGGRGFPLWVAAGCLAVLLPLELTLRVVRQLPAGNGIKRASEWGTHLAAAREAGDAALLVVGDSRVSWGVDCAALERGLARPDLTCVNGAIVWGWLPDLLPRLRAHRIRPGVLVVGLSAASLYSPVFRENFATVTAGFELPGAADRLDVRLRYLLRQHTAAGERGPVEALEDALGFARPVLAWEPYVFHRQTWAGWNAYGIPDAWAAEARRFQLEAYERQFLVERDPAVLAAADDAVVGHLRALAREVDRVVLFRMPVDPEIAAIEERAHGTRARLAAVAARAGLPYADFNDPALGGPWPVADGSHFDQRDAPPFGERLGAWIASRL